MRGFGLRQNDDIQGGQCLVPERLSDKTFQSVAHDRSFVGFFGDRQAKPRMVEFAVAAQYCKERIPAADGFFKDVLEFLASQEPLLPRELATAHRGSRCLGLCFAGLRRQARPALRPAALEHKAARFGGHPRTKTVGTFALQVAGLKGAFHGSGSAGRRQNRSSEKKAAKRTVGTYSCQPMAAKDKAIFQWSLAR